MTRDYKRRSIFIGLMLFLLISYPLFAHSLYFEFQRRFSEPLPKNGTYISNKNLVSIPETGRIGKFKIGEKYQGDNYYFFSEKMIPERGLRLISNQKTKKISGIAIYVYDTTGDHFFEISDHLTKKYGEPKKIQLNKNKTVFVFKINTNYEYMLGLLGEDYYYVGLVGSF